MHFDGSGAARIVSVQTAAASAALAFFEVPPGFVSIQTAAASTAAVFLRGATRIRTGEIKVLQTFALPLGYGTIKMER